MERIGIRGMFFHEGDRKFFVRGLTYGPFRPNKDGNPFPDPNHFQRDLDLLREVGANTLRLYHTPPPWLREKTEEAGLRLLVGVPWSQHVRFLDSRVMRAEIRNRVRTTAKDLRGTPNLLGILIGNEVPPQVVRWYGAEKVAAFLASLAQDVKEVDPTALVSYANFPTTEYLEVRALDFHSFNVYLHDETAFRRYISRLQNLADFRPLLLTEFGADSVREGEEEQARIISNSVRVGLESGCAGTVVFSFTDEWHTGTFEVEDWHFGVVRRDRSHKPAFHALKRAYHADTPPLPSWCPKVSVVVCAYNAERTMEECLSSLTRLNYPDYEVVVIDDGSTDATRAIAERYPQYRLVSRENRGLGESRNDGIRESTGEIVAFTDSDCAVDPDWLTFLVHRLALGSFAAVGGPNLPPPETDWVAECVARSPGGPTHILLTDWEAEHVPGCNMAFLRGPLVEVGMFDPVYRTAGDDVDICWKLQNAGYKVGFAAAALVWHRRRHTVSAYLKQQRGYGQAEALLYFQHPFRFNRLGHSRWLGRIYSDLGPGILVRRRPVVYGGPFGSALFQTLYEAPSSLLRYLPATLEWNGVMLGLLGAWAISTAGDDTSLLMLGAGGAMFGLSVTQALVNAMETDVSGLPRLRARLLIAYLHYVGPLLRSVERLRHRIRGMSRIEPAHVHEEPQRVEVNWLRRRLEIAFWTETGVDKDSCVGALVEFLEPRKYVLVLDNGWNSWDFQVHRGPWVRVEVKVLVEDHGQSRAQVDLGAHVRTTGLAKIVFWSLVAATGLAWHEGFAHAAVLMASAVVIDVVFLAQQGYQLARDLSRMAQFALRGLGLDPIN